MTVFALLGATALWLLYAWLLSAIVASYLAGRKGYNEKTGLATGLLLHVIGVIVWLVWPAKPGSKWKTLGPFGRGNRSAGA
jgi:fucose permease